MSTPATALEIPDSSDDEAARPQEQPFRPKAGDKGTGKADAPLEISDSDDDAAPTAKRQRSDAPAPAPESASVEAPVAKRQRTDDAPVDLTLDSGDDEAARPGSPDTDGSPNARAFWPGIPEEGDDRAPALAAGTVGGLYHVGMRQGCGADKTGARSLSERDYVETLGRIRAEVAFDMRRGTWKSKCQKKKGGPCGGHPEWSCNCPKDSRVEAVHARAGVAYEWLGGPITKNGGHNLGGSEVSAYPSREYPFVKNSREIMRAMFDPRNTAGRPCLDGTKKKTVRVRYDPDAHAALKRVAAVSKTKRVVLICVEDNLSDCHVETLIEVMLEQRLIDAATALEPTLMRPGAGWTTCACARQLDWNAELRRVKAARYATRDKK